jgi:penicillin-insensitive murein endopeptidase
MSTRRVWTRAHGALIRLPPNSPALRASSSTGDQEGAVPRGRRDRDWLSKVRPIWGHNYHFHIRIACPKDE